MRWYGLRLTTEHGVAGGTWRLLWEASVAGEQPDEGNAIFLSPDSGGCVTLYFSPSAQVLAKAVGASRCPKPEPGRLTLLAGAERAWHVHFREDSTSKTPRAQAAV
jgi:hypothetical protein